MPALDRRPRPLAYRSWSDGIPDRPARHARCVLVQLGLRAHGGAPMSKHGKRYSEQLAKVDRDREYQPGEAVALVRELAGSKFDESVEVHIRTGLNVRHADEQLRGTIALPHGLGK